MDVDRNDGRAKAYSLLSTEALRMTSTDRQKDVVFSEVRSLMCP